MVRRTLTIAQIGRTPIQIHWSFVPGMLIMSGVCSTLFIPALNPFLALCAGIGAVLLLYGGVLLHELAHGMASHAAGLPVRAITLFGFGGRTEVDEAQLAPTTELLIAAVGPLMSLILTIIWGAAAVVVEPGPLQMLALTQASVHGGLLVLNLLPGYPLDGGRMLKAALWFLTEDEIAAARSATLIARACGWALLLVGAVYALTSGDLGYALLLGMAGFFLSRTAVDGFRQLAFQRATRGVRVADVMQRTFHGVEPDLPLDQFVGRFVLGQSDMCFPVMAQPSDERGQPLLGMMTMRNLRRFAISQWTRTSIREAMTPIERVSMLTPDTSVDDALHLLAESDQDLLPVVGNSILLGVIRRRDLLFYIKVRLARMS